MRIFITGGAGFIGKYILKRLISDSHELLLLSMDEAESKFLGRYTQNIIISDLKDFQKNKQDIINFAPEIMIHLAWEGIPDFSYSFCKRNLDNSLQLINFMARETECKKFIVSGSCYEYGKQQGACKESDTVNINSAFAWAKYSLYSYADYLCRDQSIELIWFRIFYAYGPGQRRESLIPMLCKTLRKGEIPLIKNPLNANDFVYNEDIAEAFRTVVSRNVPSGIYNLGSGSTTKVIDICEIIDNSINGNKDISNIIRNKINRVPEINFWADTNKTSDVLGWKYTTSLEEGLANYELSEGE
jgi:UDP-glucose 4-epimerase